MEYAQHILDKINRYCSKNRSALQGNKSIHDYINHYDSITSVEGVGYCISYNRHQKVLPFLKAYLPYYGQTVNMTTYKEFIFSIVEIAEFIDKKLKTVRAFEHIHHTFILNYIDGRYSSDKIPDSNDRDFCIKRISQPKKSRSYMDRESL